VEGIAMLSKLKTGLLMLSLAAAPSITLGNEAPSRSDAEITARVETALVRSDEAHARQVNVETENGIVQLSGFVDSERAKTAAADAAKGVSGVQEVRNELIVREGDRSARRAADDTVIAAKVKTELAANTGLATANDVNVEVNRGVVQLSGFVASANQKQQAEQIARRVVGVTDVRNSIQVETPR
jgi:hyperosmotically inducible protein